MIGNKISIKKIKKMFKKIFTLAFLIALTPTQGSLAEKYFGYESVSPLVIEKPHKPNSKEHNDQINQIITLQKNIGFDDLKEIDLALSEKQLRPETVVQYVLKNLKRDKFPKTYKLLDRVGDTSRDVNDGIKEYWKYPRPYKHSNEVQALISPSMGYCYPSGHTTGGFIYAHIMSLLIPNKSEQFYDYANQIAWHRVLVGMHYPQDITGGKQLAIFLVGGLLQNNEFLADFNEAKEELKKNGLI